MTTFAEKAVVYSDGQVNVTPLPEAIMANGFIPETRDAPGMPLAAQHLNWLFRDLYRHANSLQQINSDLQAAKLPAWVPIPCPMENAPEGYLKCNGATFDKEKYPELAKGYPSGALPDLRGEFIRGWDDGRGIDTERKILSAQEDSIQKMTGAIADFLCNVNAVADGAFTMADRGIVASSSEGLISAKDVFFDSAKVVRSSNETRPRNVAFLYIVRAA